jgi:tetratricopeptide (TPR) repeat protein
MRLPFRRLLLVLLCAAALRARADDGESLPESTLKQIAQRQQALLADAAKQGENLDAESLKAQLQEICHEYDLLLQGSPNFAPGYVAYGDLLWKVDMRKEAVGLFLKANSIEPDIPLVKNEIGNYLAEEGKPLEAVNYFLAAIKLEPSEPLYHYELGKLLRDARADFLSSGDWTRDSIDGGMTEAFRRAAELAPDDFRYNWEYADSFGVLPNPDWDKALKLWAVVEDKAPGPEERQAARLKAADILIKQGKRDQARLLIDTVTEPQLQAQKQKLVAQLAENAKK